VIQETLPNSYRDLEEIRRAIRTLQQLVEDLPQAYRGLSAALDQQYRNNMLDSAVEVVDVEHALKSARTALAVAATKAAEIAAEHHVLLHALDLVAGPEHTPEAGRGCGS
jgi:uncharacterized protein YukE